MRTLRKLFKFKGTACSLGTANQDHALAAFLLGTEFHFAVNLGDDRRIFRFASFEQFSDSRQTARDVLRTAAFARVLGPMCYGDQVREALFSFLWRFVIFCSGNRSACPLSW